MTEPAATKLRLSSPGDLVEAVPYLLGFHPVDSLVAVALRGAGRRVVFTMRLDLPALGDAVDPAEVADLASGVATYLARARAEEAVLVTYGSGVAAGGELPDVALIRGIRGALSRRGIEVTEALHVGAGRWWSHLCSNAACCPPDGTPLVAGSSSAVAATATYAGLVARPSREALEETLEPVGFLAAEGMRRALERAAADVAARRAEGTGVESVRAESIARLTAAVDGAGVGRTPVLSDDEVARLIVALQDVAVRDACCAWATTDRSDPARRLWTDLVCRSMPPWSSVPLFLVGWFAYLAGDATLAAMAVDRCLRGDATYRFALLLREALHRAVDPAVFRDGDRRAHRRSPVRRRR
ncbi:MAG: DUF4192 domain-containing protein [Pseudonocardiales bacterium]|nr:MAG: DUF4192 domain-containing protein [Pseudonocardiales bacterium]